MRRKLSFGSDDRGVSTALTHVLTIGITTVLISGLFIGTTTMLDGQKSRAAYQEMDTIGDRLGAEITAVDQTAQRTPDGTTRVLVEHPRTVAGGTYTVRLATGGDCDTWAPDTCLILSASQTDQSVEVPFETSTDVEPTSVSGGDVYILYNADGNQKLTLEAA